MGIGRNTFRASVAGTAVLGLLLAGCGSDDDSSDEAGGDVSISVGGLPDNTKPEERKVFLDEVAAFEEANPGITLEPSELLWDQATFSAQLAGGTLPTLMDVPFGEMSGLINRNQVKDLSSWVSENETLSGINESLLATAQDGDGNTLGVPVAAYSIALVINRDLFEQAGLDPDTPFADWEAMAAGAQAITEATGARGFEHPGTEGYGGWLLSAIIAGYGDLVEVQNDDGTYEANLASDGAVQALELLRDLRWDAEAMGSNALPSANDVNNSFAAGDVGMIVTGADAYRPFTVELGFPKESYGTLPLPQDSDGLGTLGGGRIAIVRPDATDAEVDAAMKWVEFHFYTRYTTQESAVAAAEASAADGLPVPEVGLPLISQERWDAYLGWIEPQVNVPTENLAPYLESTSTMAIAPEPPVGGQEIFALLDVPVQAVLGREDADIEALLDEAQSQAEVALDGLQS